MTVYILLMSVRHSKLLKTKVKADSSSDSSYKILYLDACIYVDQDNKSVSV